MASVRRPRVLVAKPWLAGAGSRCPVSSAAFSASEPLRRPQRPVNTTTGGDFAGGLARRSSGGAPAAPAAAAAAAAAARWAPGGEAEVLRLVDLLPPDVRQRLRQHPELPTLLEVVMDLGRPPLARFPGGDVALAEAPVAAEDLQYAVDQVGDFGGDNRAGIDATLHRISCIRNRAGRVVGLTCRVGRAISGSAAMVADLARDGKSILLLGRPGVGKTTAIRELSRLLGGECQRRVVIVDTSNEIGGDGDIPHPGIGRARRMQVPHPEQQHRVMIEAVENHMPEVIVIDEIGTEAECLAARTIAQRGVQLVATAHGNELENVLKNPSLSDLVGGVSSVTLGDDEARRRGVQKSVLERQSPPTFDVCVEMASREQWRVHLDVGWAVDSLLSGREAGAEVRERDDSGEVWCWPEGGSTDFEDEEGEAAGAGMERLMAEAAAAAGGPGPRRAPRQPARRPLPEPTAFPAAALAAARGGGTAAGGADGLPPLRARVGPRAVPAPGGSGSSTKRGSGASSGSGSAALHVYAYGLDAAAVAEAAGALGVGASLALTDRIQEADVVLALRGKVKTSTWIREASRSAGIPVYSVKSTAAPSLARAVRTLLGMDPSPGALFGGGGGAPGGPRARGSLMPQAEAGGSSSGSGSRSGGGSRAPDAADALEEARLAAEQIAIPHCQPVELLPRDPGIVQQQAELVAGLGLPSEVVGAPGSRRLRVLPPAWAEPAPAPAPAATAVEGAVQTEFW